MSTSAPKAKTVTAQRKARSIHTQRASTTMDTNACPPNSERSQASKKRETSSSKESPTRKRMCTHKLEKIWALLAIKDLQEMRIEEADVLTEEQDAKLSVLIEERIRRKRKSELLENLQRRPRRNADGKKPKHYITRRLRFFANFRNRRRDEKDPDSPIAYDYTLRKAITDAVDKHLQHHAKAHNKSIVSGTYDVLWNRLARHYLNLAVKWTPPSLPKPEDPIHADFIDEFNRVKSNEDPVTPPPTDEEVTDTEADENKAPITHIDARDEWYKLPENRHRLSPRVMITPLDSQWIEKARQLKANIHNKHHISQTEIQPDDCSLKSRRRRAKSHPTKNGKRRVIVTQDQQVPMTMRAKAPSVAEQDDSQYFGDDD